MIDAIFHTDGTMEILNSTIANNMGVRLGSLCDLQRFRSAVLFPRSR
ncbi:MAG: hypothetical protein M0C28_34525 [Candidatus Moduliflexus flocculans]|nr:hypothetical protein [Candidatus Moduliflexus flocculans]